MSVLSKKEAMLHLMNGPMVQVHLNPVVEGIILPSHLLGGDRPVRLDYGFDAVTPIPDLIIDDEGIRATLSFNREPFATFVPWKAVFCLVGPPQGGIMWEADAPPAVQALAQQAVGAEDAVQVQQTPAQPAKRPRPDWLKLV